MPKLFSTQTTTSDLPLVLVAGSGVYIEHLIDILTSTSKIIHIGSTPIIGTPSDRYTFVKVLDADMINRLQEKIEYAVLYVQQEKDKPVIQDVMEKLKHDNTKISFVLDVRSVSQLYDVIQTYKELHHATFLVLGDLFSPDLPESFLSAIINRAVKQKIITLTGNDLYPIFPISLEDALDGTMVSLFGDLKKTRLFFLFYELPQTIISLVHALKGVEPELSVEYGKEERQETTKSHDQILNEIFTKTILKPEYLRIGIKGFEKGVEALNTNTIQESIHKPVEIPTPTLEQNPHLLKERFWLSSIIIGVLSFILLNVIFVLSGVILGKQAASAFQKGNYTTAEQAAKKSLVLFDISHPVLSLGVAVTHVILPNSQIPKQYQDLQTGLELTNELLNTTIPVVNQASQGISQSQLETLSNNLVDVYFTLQKFSHSSITQLQTLRQEPYLQYLSLLPTLSDIMGFHGKRTYLLLFQNNGELRPNGGFVGSVGQLTFDQGKITDFVLHDVYDPDGQLKIHMEPHYIIRRYLQPHLYLRDSTFDLDFQNSASQAASLYQTETKVHVDGVIAIDFEVVRQIIGAVGPVSLPSYHTTLNADNTFDFLENTIEDNKFAGSTQKHDVLSALFNQLIVTVGKSDKRLHIAQIIPQLLIDKHILFAFGNPSIQKIYTLENLGGTLRDTRDADNNKMNDFLSINEANIGVNKANSALSRTVQYSVALSKTAQSSVRLDYSNDFDKQYKSYVRIVTPLHSELTSITVDGVAQNIVPAVTDFREYEAKGFKPPVGLEVDTTNENNLTAFGFIIQVPAHHSQEIVINYTNGAVIPNSVLMKYSLLYNKQPGTLPYPVTFNLQYPSGYSPELISNAQLGNHIISQTTVLTTDHTFSATFHK